jgi:hypothetical protein
MIGGGVLVTVGVMWRTNVTILHQNNVRMNPVSSSMNQPKHIVTKSRGISQPDFVNGWQQQRPDHGGTVYGETDSFLKGRSCHWQESGIWGKVLSRIFFFARYSFAGQWECRDCGIGSNYMQWKECPILRRRGKCYPFKFQGWDNPRPSIASSYDYTSAEPYPIHVQTSFGVGKVQKIEYHQPSCHHLTKPCFDMDRCVVAAINATQHRQLRNPLLVYAYPGIARQDLEGSLSSDKRILLFPSRTAHHHLLLPLVPMQMTNDPAKACLLIVNIKDVDRAKSKESWNFGRNHFVYGITEPISKGIHYDMAALGSVVMTNAQVRLGYDIPLPLPALWSIPKSKEPLHLHRPRRWLISFKGSIQDTLQPYYQHRWLAAEYWDDDDTDVTIDVQCKHKGMLGELTTVKPYDNPSQDHFDDLMLNSTFAFCPGGSHVSSYRLTESLSTGSIPVLLPEVVTPFSPELDWSRCVIWVSQARIIDLPRILRSIPSAEVEARQKECRRLYEVLQMQQQDSQARNHESSLSSSSSRFLSTALLVWHLRIQKQEMEDRLHRDYFDRNIGEHYR